MIGFCLILFLQQILSSSILAEGNLSPKAQNDSPIKAINNDEIAALSQYGDGTELTPYVIENLIISSTNVWGITLENIDVHLIIRYCEISNSLGGIYMKYCENITISNNSFQDLSIGIEGYFAQHLVIGNNTFIDCKNSGIYFFVDNDYHLVQDNQFYSCGIDILGGFGTHNQFANNYANNKEIIVIMSQGGTIIENRNDIGEILLIHSQNCVISNVTIEDSTPAINIHNSDYTQIINCSIGSSLSLGLRIYSSDHVDILNCNFTNNLETAIQINYCDSANIEHNLFLQNGGAISAEQVWDYLITNNTIIGINEGLNHAIYIFAGYGGNKIINNTIGYCDSECIYLNFNSYSEIINNTLINEENNFIKLEDDTDSTFEGNMNYILDPNLFVTQSQSNDSIDFSFILEWKSSVFVSEYIIFIDGDEFMRAPSSCNSSFLYFYGYGQRKLTIKTISTLYSYEYEDFNPLYITLYDYELLNSGDEEGEGSEDETNTIDGFPIGIMMLPLVFIVGILVRQKKTYSQA